MPGGYRYGDGGSATALAAVGPYPITTSVDSSSFDALAPAEDFLAQQVAALPG